MSFLKGLGLGGVIATAAAVSGMRVNIPEEQPDFVRHVCEHNLALEWEVLRLRGQVIELEAANQEMRLNHDSWRRLLVPRLKPDGELIPRPTVPFPTKPVPE